MEGRKLRFLRLLAGISQMTLARKVGVSQVRVSYWERDLYPVPPILLPRVLAALNAESGPSRQAGGVNARVY